MLQIKLSRRDQNGDDTNNTHLFAIIIWCAVDADGDYVTDLELRKILIGNISAVNEWNFQRIAAKFYTDVEMTIDEPRAFVEKWNPPAIFS